MRDESGERKKEGRKLRKRVKRGGKSDRRGSCGGEEGEDWKRREEDEGRNWRKGGKEVAEKWVKRGREGRVKGEKSKGKGS